MDLLRKKSRFARFAVFIATFALLFSGLPHSATAAPPRVDEVRVNAQSLLSKLPVAEEAFSATYSRALFRHWIDADSNGCDTRRDVLASEVGRVVSCRSLAGGIWISEFDRIKTRNPSGFDVDHMVPLKEAWESGAYAWDSTTRTSFENDIDYQHTLIAVSAKSNRSKSDRDPNNWMPPAISFHCQYAGRWVAVKYRWSLSVDSREQEFLVSLIAQCGSKADVVAPVKASIGTVAVPSQTPQPVTTPKQGTHPRFASCAEAQRNGYRSPYFRGVNPEYAWYEDRDADGVVCE
jgi:hypothetical protein